MKNSKVKGLLGLLVLLFAVGLFGFFGYDTMDDIKLGLDLAGGVSITYQAVDENPTQVILSVSTPASVMAPLTDFVKASIYSCKSASTSPVERVVREYSLVCVP